MGLSWERIRQIREQLGAPDPTHPDRKRKTRQALQWAKGNLDELEVLSPAELGRKYGLSRSWLRFSNRFCGLAKESICGTG